MQHPLSLTHQHLLSIINTEILKRKTGGTLRILDAGCGNGELIYYLSRSLEELHPEIRTEVYGLDVSDHHVQKDGFFDLTKTMLSERMPNIQWESRLSLIGQTEPWPYETAYFDCILSNQVCEHIFDHVDFFKRIKRHLKVDGFSCHLFPLKNYILEGHSRIPFAHRFKSFETRKAFIKFMTRMGFGDFNSTEPKASRDQFSEDWAIKLALDCFYSSPAELINKSHCAGLVASFKYTRCYYFSKIRSILRRRLNYTLKECWLAEWFCFLFFKYIASITLFLENKVPTSIQQGERH
ncbi:MAG: SAM-dependent methyltransferase [Acidobacteria bacterium]|nr:MAG: SAM-dependent methyltransferase [Acidobacteriota bacterium]